MNNQEHLNWSTSYLESSVSNPVIFLVSQMRLCLSQMKFCLHSAVFGSSHDNVCTYVKSQANYKLIQNQKEAENWMTRFVYTVCVGEGGGGTIK